jgi:hypothetical protein
MVSRHVRVQIQKQCADLRNPLNQSILHRIFFFKNKHLYDYSMEYVGWHFQKIQVQLSLCFIGLCENKKTGPYDFIGSGVVG